MNNDFDLEDELKYPEGLYLVVELSDSILGAIALTTVLQILLIYVAPLRNFFETSILSFTDLLICLGFSLLVFVWVEMEKLFQRYFLARRK